MHFFLGSNSPKGFFSKMDIFSENLPSDWKCNVIKGGPGCGKSTYMKKIADEIIDMGFEVEYIHCPSDPLSLDAIICDDLKLCYVDGTAPHVIDPVYPGISGKIIDLGSKRKVNKSSKDKIRDLDDKSKDLRSRSQKYLISFRSILSNSIEESIKKINTENINKLIYKIKNKFFKKDLTKKSKQLTRLISSMGPKGLLFFNQNFEDYEVYQINDDLNLETDILFRKLLNESNAKGYNSIICLNPLAFNEKIESLIFPEINFAIFAKNRWQSFFESNKPDKIFESESKLIKEDINLLDSLIKKTKISLSDANNYHSKIEKEYY